MGSLYIEEELKTAVLIPRQVPTKEEFEQIQSLGTTAQVAVSNSAGSSIISNFFLSLSLSQVWSLVNGLQVVVHMPLFNCKFPANAAMSME